MRTLLTNATVIDCVSPTPVPGATVVIEDGRIDTRPWITHHADGDAAAGSDD